MSNISIICLLCLFSGVYGSKILLVPMQGKSHMISINSIGQELNSRGHQIYTLADNSFKGKAKQIGATGLEILYYKVQEGTTSLDSEETHRELIKMILEEKESLDLLISGIVDTCKNMVEDEELMKTVSTLKFDLAIIETHFIPCSYILPHIFKIPHVTVLPDYFRTMIRGSVDMPSYQPSSVFEPESLPMTFTERFKNTLFYILLNREIVPWFLHVTGIMPRLHDTSMIEQYKQKGLVSRSINTWFDFVDETQLFIIINNDMTFGHPKPLFPNVISVEGISAVEAKPLPKDLEALVQSSEHGVIVVSFGSNVKHLPDTFTMKMVNAFRRRKELFLMRFSGELSDKNFVMPANVKFMSWLPQNDLLAHKKTKLFITHGGLYGLHEAVYQGVPMLCVPLLGDQPSNAKKLKGKGYGLYFDLLHFTEEELLEKIEEIISNPSYRQKTQRAGQIMRHRPMNARQTAAFWIEHVLKFGGEHLKPSSIHLAWWQFYCLDTLGVILIAIILILWIVISLIKIVIKTILKMFSAKSHAKKD